MDIERTLTIAEMAASFGVSHRSLRFYEERGLLHPRRDGTSRHYYPRDVVRLQLVLKGKKLGFSLDEIARLILAQAIPRPEGGTPDATAHLSRVQLVEKLAALEAERRRVVEAIGELRSALDRTPRELAPA